MSSHCSFGLSNIRSRRMIMSIARFFTVQICASLLVCLPAAAANVVTGNGFGFAVVSPKTAMVTKFYAHPYSFERPDSKNPLGEGIETPNFVKALGWNEGTAQSASAEYEGDSHVIHARSSDGEGLVFMPFGLEHAALIISWVPGSAQTQRGGLHVEWSHPVRSQRVVRMFDIDMQLLKFDGIEESLLLIPLSPNKITPPRPHEYLSTSPAWALISLESNSDLEQTAREFRAWRVGLTPRELAKREVAEIERWRIKPAVHFASENE